MRYCHEHWLFKSFHKWPNDGLLTHNLPHNEGLEVTHGEKTAYLLETSNACMLSIHGLARYRQLFLRNDWRLTDNCSDADLILHSTCAFNKEQEDRSIETIRKLQRERKPGSKLIVCGCLPRINEPRLVKVFDGITFSPYEVDKIDALIKAHIRISQISHVETDRKAFANQASVLYSFNRIIADRILKPFILVLHKHFKVKIEPYYKILSSLYDHRIYYIQACTGCLGKCSYCAIRRAKGTLKSVPISRIIDDFQYGLAKGYKKFSLIGDDLGFYGRDINTDLPTLLQEMLKEEGDYELLLYYVEPMDFEKMFPRLRKVFGSGKIIDVNIPIQTGSNRIAKLMKRNCNVETVRKYASKLRKEFPWLNVRTHVIVGFPGETEEDFEKSLGLFDDFDEVGIFEYTDRPHTPASRMTNKVPDAVKKARMKRIRRKYLYDLYFKKLLNIKILISR